MTAPTALRLLAALTAVLALTAAFTGDDLAVVHALLGAGIVCALLGGGR